MSLSVHVAMGELAVSEDKETVFETFVGSCVALCLYDPYAKIAGIAHIMLPESFNGKTSSNSHGPAKYADEAIEIMVNMMVKKGAKTTRIKAKMSGGANMFSHEAKSSFFNVGERNAQSVKTLLKNRGIPLLSEDTGMDYGRLVRFSAKSGELIVRSRKAGERSL